MAAVGDFLHRRTLLRQLHHGHAVYVTTLSHGAFTAWNSKSFGIPTSDCLVSERSITSWISEGTTWALFEMRGDEDATVQLNSAIYRRAGAERASTRIEMENLEQRVVATIAKAVPLDPARVRPSSTFEELELDSLDIVNIVFELEITFDIKLPDDFSLSDLKDVGAVTTALAAFLSKEAA